MVMLDIVTDTIGIHQQAGPIIAYHARPKESESVGGLIVLHEFWGLNSNIKQVVERFASEGYYVIAPNLLSNGSEHYDIPDDLQKQLLSNGMKERNEAQLRLQTIIAPTKTPHFAYLTIARLLACFNYLYNQPALRQRVAVLGFSFGGTYAYSLAVHEPRLRAAIPFYGHANYVEQELKHIRCPILAFYGQNDQTLVDEVLRLLPHMTHAGVHFTPLIYPDSGHAFFNDTNPQTYNAAVAADALRRSIDFLHLHMR